MRLTTARYFTPSGQSIQATGIEPDIFVAQATIESQEPARRRRESDLRGALENSGGTNGDGTTEEPGAETGTEADAEGEEDEAEDFQLARAVDLLRGLALFNERVVN
jgi:carboxyl-terminal processing protease